MPGQKIAREIRVAVQRVQAGTRREIAIHVWIIREQPVGDAAWRDFAGGIHRGLVAIPINVAPPSLRVADEIDRGKFLQDFVKPLDVLVVFVVLKMHQHRHAKILRDFRDLLDGRRIAIHLKFLFADADRASFQPMFNFRARAGKPRHFIGEENIFARMVQREIVTRLVSSRVGFQM